MKLSTHQDLLRYVKKGKKLSLATQNYPSRGQTAIQELYQTKKGKFFLKQSSKKNHIECQINIQDGTLAQREYWAFCLAKKIGLHVPELWLIDQFTTIQIWLDYPDARTFATSQGKMIFLAENVFNCALFDWIAGQIDRHDANYLYNYAHQEIILIDSAHCFLKYSGSMPDYLKYTEIGFSDYLSKKIKSPIHENILRLTPKLILKLVPLINPKEQESVIQRLEESKKCFCIGDVIKLYRGK